MNKRTFPALLQNPRRAVFTISKSLDRIKTLLGFHLSALLPILSPACLFVFTTPASDDADPGLKEFRS